MWPVLKYACGIPNPPAADSGGGGGGGGGGVDDANAAVAVRLGSRYRAVALSMLLICTICAHHPCRLSKPYTHKP